MSKRIVGILALILTALISARIALAGPNEPHAGNAMWIEPSSIDLSSQSVGYKFNVTVYANITSVPGTSGIGGWQVKLTYNNTQLNATRAWYKVGTTPGQSEFFQDITVKTVSPKFGSGYVLHGESWAGDPTTGPFAYANATNPRMGGLAIVEFNLTGLVPQGGNVTNLLDIKSNWPSDTYVLDYDSASKILDIDVYNATVVIPVVPEFAIAAYFLIALIATSTLSLLVKKSLKRQK